MTRHDGMDPSVGMAPGEAGRAAWACYEGIGRKRAHGVLACSQIDDRYHGSNEDPFPTGRVPRKSQDQTSSDKLK